MGSRPNQTMSKTAVQTKHSPHIYFDDKEVWPDVGMRQNQSLGVHKRGEEDCMTNTSTPSM